MSNFSFRHWGSLRFGWQYLGWASDPCQAQSRTGGRRLSRTDVKIELSPNCLCFVGLSLTGPARLSFFHGRALVAGERENKTPNYSCTESGSDTFIAHL